MRARRSYSACRRRLGKCHPHAADDRRPHGPRAVPQLATRCTTVPDRSPPPCAARRVSNIRVAPVRARLTALRGPRFRRLLSKRPASVLTLATLHAPRSTHVSAVFIGKPYISHSTRRRRRPTDPQKVPRRGRGRRRDARPDRGVLADLRGGGHRAYPSRAARAGAGVKSAVLGTAPHVLSLPVAKKVPRR